MKIGISNKTKKIIIYVVGLSFISIMVYDIFFLFEIRKVFFISNYFSKNKLFLNLEIIFSILGFFFSIFLFFFLLKQENFNIAITKKVLTDKLTSAYNREFLEIFFKKERIKDYIFVMIDIDHFKLVNDEHGHSTGDVVLKRLSSLIHSLIRKDDKHKFIRLGGEEFLFILYSDDFSSIEDVLSFLERVRSSIKKMIFTDNENNQFSITVSFGVNYNSELNRTVREAIDFADIALYKAKINRDCIVCYDDYTMNTKYFTSSDILSSLKSNAILCHYQPIIDLKTKLILRYESLIRINHKNKIFYPFSFLNLLKRKEDKILILKKVLEYNISYLIKNKTVNVSLNLDIDDLLIDEIYEHLIAMSIVNKNISSRIILEIKETKAVPDVQKINKILKLLKEADYRLSIDDFSLSSSFLVFSSLEYFDEIKISSLLIKSLNSKNNNSFSIIKTIVYFAKKNKINIVGTHIESKIILDSLISLGVDSGEGFYIGKPTSLL